MQLKEQITVFTGHFGSGKTELAINYSRKLSKTGKKVTLVDLDIVNPFFRSADVKEILEEKGIKVLTPNFAGTTVDVPSLPAEIYSVFDDPKRCVVFDVGGDDIGATALGGYYPKFASKPYRMFYVINVYRPLSNKKEDIINMLRAVERNSRLHVTDLVNNSNLAYETNASHVNEGQVIIENIARELGLPISLIAGKHEILDDFICDYIDKGFVSSEYKDTLFPIDIYMKPPWY